MSRKITIIFADGSEHIYRDAPDNTTLAQTQARVGRDFPDKQVAHINGGRAAIPANVRAPQQQTQTQPGRARSFGEGLLQGFENVVAYPGDLLNKGLAALGDKNAQLAIQGQRTGARAQEQRTAQYRQAHPNYFTAGDIAGGTFATLPVGAGLGGVVRTATTGTRLARAGEAVATGLGSSGFKTGLVPTRAAIQAAKDEGINIAPTLVQRVVDMATRGTTGAVTNATTAKLTGQDAGDAAIFGGILPTVGSMGARVAMDKVILPAYERLTGQVGAQRAAEIFRASFKMSIDKVREIARNAPEGVPFTQVLAKTNTLAGKNAETTAQALGRSIEQGPGGSHFTAVSENQNAARQAQLNAMAQGQTPTEVNNAILAGKTKLGEEYATNIAPVMKGANLGGKIIPSAEANAAKLTADANAKLALAQQQREAAQRLSGSAAFHGKSPAFISGADAAAHAAETSEQMAARMQQEAQDIQSQINNLRSQGHDVLTTGPIVAQLRNMAGAPGVLGSIEKSTPLLKMAAHIESLGPIIRAEDLDAVRQSAGQFVSHLTNDPSGIARHASSLMAATKPVIDTAIEGAGGVGYGAAKNAFAEGSKELGQQAFVGDLARAHAASPEDYAAIVGGYKPEVVKQAFPTGGKQNFDIGAMLPPERLAPLQDIAGEIDLGTEAAKQAGIGKTDTQALLAQGIHPGEKLKGMFVKLLSAKAGKLDSFVNLLAQSGISKGTQSALVDAFKSGKGADELLSLMPLADQYQLFRRGISGGTNRAISALGVNAMNALNTPPPPGEVLVGEGVGPSGERYPMYGSPSSNINAMRR